MAARSSPAKGDALRDDVVRRLEPLPVTTRRLFGGWGLYMEGRFFGVISDGRVYFRTDDVSRKRYLGLGSAALQPKFRTRGKRTVDRNFEVPSAVFADRRRLRRWAIRAAQA